MLGLAAESDSEPRMIASQPENYLFMSFRTVRLRISNRLRTAESGTRDADGQGVG